MHHNRTRGVTLIELMVTMVVSSVVLVGLGTLYLGASADFRDAAAMREDRYARQSLESELVWRLKVVPPDLLPNGTNQLPPGGPTAPGFTITYTDDAGLLQTRRVLAFDYLANDTRSFCAPNPGGMDLFVDGPGCLARIPNNGAPEKIDVKTAAIFQYNTAVYWVERPIANPAESFRSMARANTLAPALIGRFATPMVPLANATPPLPLAIGISTFDVSIIEPPGGIVGACGTSQLADSISKRRVTWNYTQFSTFQR